MKQVIQSVLTKTFSVFLAASGLSAGAAYNRAAVSLEEEEPPAQSVPVASKAVLSYKGDPICMTDASEDMTPSFIRIQRDQNPALDYDGSLPNCNEEEKDIVFQTAQNAAPAGEKGGVDVAGAPLALVICVAGAGAGAVAKVMENSGSLLSQTEKTMIPYITATVAGAPLAATVGSAEAAAATAPGGAFAVSETAIAFGKTLSYLNSFLKTGAVIATCSGAAYYAVSYIMN